MNILMTMVWSDAAALGRSRLSTCGARGPIRCGQWSPEQNIIAALRPVQGKQNTLCSLETNEISGFGLGSTGPLSRQN